MIMVGDFLNLYNSEITTDYSYFSVKGVLSDKKV